MASSTSACTWVVARRALCALRRAYQGESGSTYLLLTPATRSACISTARRWARGRGTARRRYVRTVRSLSLAVGLWATSTSCVSSSRRWPANYRPRGASRVALRRANSSPLTFPSTTAQPPPLCTTTSATRWRARWWGTTPLTPPTSSSTRSSTPPGATCARRATTVWWTLPPASPATFLAVAWFLPLLASPRPLPLRSGTAVALTSYPTPRL
mmetsp:Transcript_32744/g.58659  ORF Transcript_32744/g.58659 Transcript_32744/m.58659 type:complete len:213 (-) Transcript_32744:545-1183(-)